MITSYILHDIDIQYVLLIYSIIEWLHSSNIKRMSLQMGYGSAILVPQMRKILGACYALGEGVHLNPLMTLDGPTPSAVGTPPDRPVYHKQG